MQDFEKRDVWRLAAGFRRVSRVMAAVIICVAVLMGGATAFAGAALGAILVELNLGVLVRALRRNEYPSPEPRNSAAAEKRRLAFSLLRFYLLFVITALACFLIVKYRLGDPLAFLAGLCGFILALPTTLVLAALRPGLIYK